MASEKSSYNAYKVQTHSPEVMLMTREEFNRHTHEAFLAGVERGCFEEACDPKQAMTLQELEQRLVEATGPDRELDYAILEQVNPEHHTWCVNRERELRAICAEQGLLKDRAHRDAFSGCPQFSASVDSALSLVPDGLYWLLVKGRLYREEPLFGMKLFKPDCQGDDYVAGAEHEHAALALCLAITRARISMEPKS